MTCTDPQATGVPPLDPVARNDASAKTVEVAKEFHPDPSDASGKFGMVSVKALHPVKSPVSLADIKADGRFEEFALIRQSRLSVVPVSDEHWRLLSEMAGVKP